MMAPRARAMMAPRARDADDVRGFMTMGGESCRQIVPANVLGKLPFMKH